METVVMENGMEVIIHNTEGLSNRELTKQAEEAYKSGSRIEAMSFCEPRSCIGRLSS